jgi:rubrerythrin
VSQAGALQALDMAMEREMGGNRFYLEAADRTIDSKGKHMFQWLAKEELKHLRWVEQQRQAIIQGKRWQEVAGLDDLLITKADFPEPAESAGTVKTNIGELEALSLGIKAEKDSIALYLRAGQDTIDIEGKAMFARLVQEEQTHLDILEEEYEWLRQSRGYFTIHRFQLPGR